MTAHDDDLEHISMEPPTTEAVGWADEGAHVSPRRFGRRGDRVTDDGPSLGRTHIIREITRHRPVGDPDATSRPALALSELAAALAEIKRTLPDFRHKTGGIVLQSLKIVDDGGSQGGRQRIEAPLSLRFYDCDFSSPGVRSRADDETIEDEPEIQSPICLSGLSINALALDTCRFHGPLWIDDTYLLETLSITATEIRGWLQIQRTRVQGDIRISGRIGPKSHTVRQPPAMRLRLLDCRVGGVLWLADPLGLEAVELHHTGVGDEFGIQKASLTHLVIADCRFDDDLKVIETNVDGLVEVRSSTIRGDVTWTRLLRAIDRSGAPDPFCDDTGDKTKSSISRIDLTEIEVGGGLALEDLLLTNRSSEMPRGTMSVGLTIARSNFGGSVTLARVEIADGLSVKDSRIAGLLRMNGTRFGIAPAGSPEGVDPADPRRLPYSVDIRNSEVTKGIEFASQRTNPTPDSASEYLGQARLIDSRFGKVAFNQAEFTQPGKDQHDKKTTTSIEVTRCAIGGSLTFTGNATFLVPVVFTSVDVTGAVEFKGAFTPEMIWKDSRIAGAFAFVCGHAGRLQLDGTRCEELRLFAAGDREERDEIKSMPGVSPAQTIDSLHLIDTHVGRLSGNLEGWLQSKTDRSDGHPALGRCHLHGFTFDRLDAEAWDSLAGKNGIGAVKWLTGITKEWGQGSRDDEQGAPTAATDGGTSAEAHKSLASRIWKRLPAVSPGPTKDGSKKKFDPRPWIHLANVFRQMGDDDKADDIVVEARKHLRRSDTWFERVIDRLLLVTSRYGYSPTRTLVTCALFLVVAGCASLQAGLGDRLVVFDEAGEIRGCDAPTLMTRRVSGDFELSAMKDHKAATYPAFDAVLYHLDTFFPLLDLDMHSSWIANTGVVWNPKARAYLMPVASLPKSCLKDAEPFSAAAPAGSPASGSATVAMPAVLDSPKPKRTIAVRLWSGGDVPVHWYGQEPLPAEDWAIPIGRIFFWAFTLERIVGGILTALLIVGLTGILRKSGER